MSQAVFAVIVCMSAIFAFTTVLFVVGPFVDAFQGKISSVDITWEGEAMFPTVATVGNDMFTWFFSVLVFFIYFFVLWMFKVVIWKHLYSREDAGGGYNNDYRV